jgi:hypothetical protein
MKSCAAYVKTQQHTDAAVCSCAPRVPQGEDAESWSHKKLIVAKDLVGALQVG